MISLIVFLTGIITCVITLGIAALSDIKTMTIENRYTGILIGAYGIVFGCLWILSDINPLPALLSSGLAALIIFLVTFVLFALNLLGAADSKLATALSLWIGLKGIVPFLLYMTLAGGALALLSIFIRNTKPFKVDKKSKSWIAQTQNGESKVPYGVAILIGALASFSVLGYFKYETFVSFM